MIHFFPSHLMNDPNKPQQTPTQMRTYLIQNLPDPHGPAPVPYGPITSSRPTGYSTAPIELLGSKKGIKREIAVYPSQKDERYFDGFKRSFFIVANSHKCNEVVEPTYTPGSEPEQQELFDAKQTFMFSIFNANLQTDMGKTIVRRHLDIADAQSCRILGLTTFNYLLQYVNWLAGRFVLSTIVNQNKEAWLQESKLAKMLCTSCREFGTNRWKFLPKVKHFIF